MSAPEPKDASTHDPVIDAIDNAPLDEDALSTAETERFAALVAAGPGDTKTTPDVLAELAERAMTG